MWEKASSRALYTVDIWDGPAIRLCFTKYDIYFECRGKGEILKNQLSCPKV